jgi:hypothetical protein
VAWRKISLAMLVDTKANVMVAYPIEEAKELLTQKLSSQETGMKTCQEDLEFLREQITTMEVNIGIPRLSHYWSEF